MSQNTLREQLAEAFDRDISDETVSRETTPQETTENSENVTLQENSENSDNVQGEKPRDEAGKFVSKEEIARPTTWKKDYLPIWDKVHTNEPLTPEESANLLKYINQREGEYKTGVSTYKTEAESAKQLQEALAPFMPTLQQHNIEPTTWISNLGNAHQLLALGTPEQKLQAFAKLAQDYGVPMEAFTGEYNPNLMQNMQQNSELSNQVNSLTNWMMQQEEREISSEIEAFSGDKNYPYFEDLKEDMAQLLESGKADDLKQAYKIALVNNDELMEKQFQERLAAQQATQQKAVAVEKAKSRAVSPKSSTPTGTGKAEAKDRRSVLAEQFDGIGERV